MVDDILADDDFEVIDDTDDEDLYFNPRRARADLDLMIAHAELELHINAAKQCIRDNDYLLYLYNKRNALIYLEEVKECRVKVIEAMFGVQ